MKLIAAAAAALALSTSGALADFVEGRNAYLEGDYQLAYREFASSAEKGDAKSQVGLGLLYTWGQGIPPDYIEAFTWFHRAATKVGRMHPVVRTLARINRDYLVKQMSQDAVEEALSKAQPALIASLENFGDMPQDMFMLSVTEVVRNESRSQNPSIPSGLE